MPREFEGRVALVGRDRHPALARAEFTAMLRQVVAWHDPSGTADIDRQCRELLEPFGSTGGGIDLT